MQTAGVRAVVAQDRPQSLVSHSMATAPHGANTAAMAAVRNTEIVVAVDELVPQAGRRQWHLPKEMDHLLISADLYL